MTHYAVISETDYYGPSQTIDLVSEHKTAEEARAAAEAYNPDYDASVQMCRLGHNQASPTRGIAVQYIHTVAVDGYEGEDEEFLSAYKADYILHDGGQADLYRRIPQ